MTGVVVKLPYVECGPGWEQIYKPVIAMCLGRDGLSIFQIKEKFGTLRIYLDYDVDKMPNGPPKRIIEAIERAEHLSAETCEICGASGHKRTDRYWIKTLCDDCHTRRKR